MLGKQLSSAKKTNWQSSFLVTINFTREYLVHDIKPPILFYPIILVDPAQEHCHVNVILQKSLEALISLCNFT